MARPPAPAPRRLYAEWPHAPVAEPEHEKIRATVLAARSMIDERYASVREAARKLDMSHAVLNAALTGHSWPSAITVARMELGLGADLWPANQRLTQ